MKNKKGKTFWSDVKKGIATSLGMLLIFAISVGAFNLYQNSKSYGFDGEVTSDIDDNTVMSEAQERFHLTTPSRTAEFYINVITTNNNKSYNIGMFEMDYIVKSSLEHPDERIVDVVYKVPANWLISEASDENVNFEEKLRNPPIQKEIRRDPTFYRGKDYSKNIPFEEIEITTDFIYQYTDTNETEYNFIVRVYENKSDMNIREVQLIVPEDYEVRVE